MINSDLYDMIYPETTNYGINGSITGTTTDKTIACYNRSTKALVSTTTSVNLMYSFYSLDLATEYFVVALDPAKISNGAIADRPPVTFLLRTF